MGPSEAARLSASPVKLVPVKPVPRANTLYCIPIYAYRIAPSPLSCFVCACVPVGGAQDRVEIYLIAHPDDDQTKARRLLTEQFSTFNAGKAQCFLASDRATLLAGSSWTTHTLLFFYFEYGDNLCIVFFSFSCLPPGPALQDDVLLSSLFTFASCR